MLNAIKKQMQESLQLPVTMEVIEDTAVFTVTAENILIVRNVGGMIFAGIAGRNEANIALCGGLDLKVPRSVIHNAIKFLMDHHWNVLSFVEVQDRFTSLVLSHCDLSDFMDEVTEVCETESYLIPNMRTLNHLMQMKLGEVREESLYLIGDDYDYEVETDHPDFLLGNYNG